MRETRQDLRDQMKQRLNSSEGQKIYRKRLHPIESLFGHLKYNLNYSHFLLRGLEKVKAEFTLMCLSYNLRKLITNFCCFLAIDYSIRLSTAQTVKKIGFPRFVNELLLNTLKFLLATLHLTNSLMYFKQVYSRPACTAIRLRARLDLNKNSSSHSIN